MIFFFNHIAKAFSKEDVLLSLAQHHIKLYPYIFQLQM